MFLSAVTFAFPYLGLVSIPETGRAAVAAGRAAVAAGTHYYYIDVYRTWPIRGLWVSRTSL